MRLMLHMYSSCADLTLIVSIIILREILKVQNLLTQTGLGTVRDETPYSYFQTDCDCMYAMNLLFMGPTARTTISHEVFT